MESLFRKGKLTFLMDGQAGSSGKGKTASYICEKSNEWQFACNTFSANAAHWVKLDDGKKYLYRALNSCAYNVDKYEKLYVGPGSIIETSALLQEIEENNIPAHKIGISPMAVIIQDADVYYEKGLRGFDGEEATHAGTMLSGSTCSGVGAAAARRLLRGPRTKLAKDDPLLNSFLCNVSEEIVSRLDRGQSGLFEVAQGYQLSMMHQKFYPFTTFRNVTTSQAMSDMMLPPVYAGPVILNFRTFPIRINSNKYIAEDGRHLTWDEVNAGVKHKVFMGYSGGWYDDQKEISWDDLTRMSRSPFPIMEITSKTKLPRRVATFSFENLNDAARYNITGHGLFISLNFADYVDYEMFGVNACDKITDVFNDWLVNNLGPQYLDHLILIGTGPRMGDMIEHS